MNINNYINLFKEVTVRKKGIGYTDWWDRSCTKEKRKVNRVLRIWKAGGGIGAEKFEK